jgi:selenocysteine lyase/cysteine desulfurase
MAGMNASLDLMLAIGVEAIESRVLGLAAQLADGLRARGYHLAGSTKPGERSAIVSFTRDSLDVTKLSATLKERKIAHHTIHQRIRMSPHLYNSPDDVIAALTAL